MVDVGRIQVKVKCLEVGRSCRVDGIFLLRLACSIERIYSRQINNPGG